MPVPEPDDPGITAVVTIAHSFTDAQIRQLVAALSGGNLSLSAGVLPVQHIIRLSMAEARNVVTLLRHWHNAGGTSETLVAALLAARAAYAQALEEAPSVRLVWTGPISTSVPARSTVSVLLDLIDRARKEMIVVGYILTEAASIVLEHLAAAQKRGVQVVLIGDRMEEKLSVLQVCWPEDQRLPVIYTRAETPDDPRSALHAKLAIADQYHMLVTSANLTYHGLAGNIEMGIEVEGQVAADAVALLNGLIAEGICTRILTDR